MTDQPADPQPALDLCPECSVPTTALTPGDPDATRVPCGHPATWPLDVYPGVVPDPAPVLPPAAG